MLKISNLNIFRNYQITRHYCASYKTTNILNVFVNNKIEDKVCLQGWVKSLRKMKQNIFLDISDGSSDHKLQVTFPSENKPKNLTTGASIKVKGCLTRSPKDQLELTADEITVVGSCVIADGYPFAPRKSYPPEYIREYLHLRPRTNKFASLLRTRHVATKVINDYFDLEGYFHIHTPILTSNDCEGAGEVFSVQPENKKLLKSMVQKGMPLDEAYFNTKAYLTVSGQLHLEAVAHGLSKVYTFGPTFRAENSKSRLHLSEFYMIEAEVAFVDQIQELCDIIEHFVKNITKNIITKCGSDIDLIQTNAKQDYSWLDKKFIVMTYEEALKFLDKHRDSLNLPVNYQQGFTKEDEILLVEWNGNVPVFIINWPKDNKPFYMKQCPHDSTKVKIDIFYQMVQILQL